MYPTKSTEEPTARFKHVCLLVLLVILPTSKTLSAGTNFLDLPVSEKYRAEFPNGAKIELLAVSNNNWQLTWQRRNNVQPRNERRRSKPGYWWRPDGTRIPTEEVTFKRRRFSAGTGASQFDFLVRVNGIDPTELTAMYEDNPLLHRVKVDSATDFRGNVLPNLFVISVPGFPRHGLVVKAAIHFGIEVGRWQYAEVWQLDWAKITRDSCTLHSGVGALIEVPVQTRKGVEVDLTHVYVNTPIRLVALDHTDRLHVAKLADRGVGIGIARRLCTFENMKLEEIKTIIFQRRDHQWLEFSDVVLEPHHVRPFTSWRAVKKLIGKPAPEFQRIKGWKNGGPIRLADLKGKVVVLDFWNYRCGACLFEMPKLMALHERYSNQGLVVIGIHSDMVESIKEMDEKLAMPKDNFWNGHDIPFVVALDGGGRTEIVGTKSTTWGATTAAYGVLNFPTTILINKDGVVLGELSLDNDEFEQRIKALLKEP